MQRELAATRDYLQSVIEDKESANEELRAANEEVQSANEELQSINEELETAKEELQSTNEELVTVNDELSGRNAELGALTDDLSNLFAASTSPSSWSIGTARAPRHAGGPRRARPRAGALELLLADLDLPLDVPDLSKLVKEVIDTLAPLAREIQDHQGRWYLAARASLHRPPANAVAGAVIALVDIDEIKRSAEEIRETALLNAALARHPPRHQLDPARSRRS